jgi:urease accessory protein
MAVSGPSRIVIQRRQISVTTEPGGWSAQAWLTLTGQGSGHQAGATAPLKWLRSYDRGDGYRELPLLHTAGGLVGGDRLQVAITASGDSQALLTTVAAQKVYGSLGRFRQDATPRWAHQSVVIRLRDQAALEWLPQELVLYGDGLLQQELTVELEPGCSWLGTDVVRLGRSAAGEGLGQGCWRSSLTIRRRDPAAGDRWELVDRLSLDRDALQGQHGMAGRPVLGTLVWAAPDGTGAAALDALVAQGRQLRQGLDGAMAVGRLEQGLIARYRGDASQMARFWFCRLWGLLRRHQGQDRPALPRVWPFQEDPWLHDDSQASGEFNLNDQGVRALAE